MPSVPIPASPRVPYRSCPPGKSYARGPRPDRRANVEFVSFTIERGDRSPTALQSSIGAVSLKSPSKGKAL